VGFFIILRKGSQMTEEIEFNAEDALDLSKDLQASQQADKIPNFGTPEYREWKTEQLRRMATDPVYLETQMEFIRGARKKR